jgi:GAF domain-containing protein
MSDLADSADDPTPTQTAAVSAGPAVDLGWALSQMAGLVLSRETVDTALELVTSLAATATAGTVGAAVTIVDEHGKRSLAASNQTAERADALQYEFDEGPCLTALRTQQMVRIDDTSTDARWPRWNKGASELGIRSVLSAPLHAGDEPAGAMKIYCDRPLNYGPHAEPVMKRLAAQAAILLANTQSLQQARRLSRQLTAAVASRDTIAAATGVLMARGAVSRQDAFVALAAAARESGRPVEDVAQTMLAALTARNSTAAGS